MGAFFFFFLIGVTAATLREHNPFKLARARLPWLAVNLVSGLACAGIAQVFDQTLAEALILAMFIPLVLTLSESATPRSIWCSILCAAVAAAASTSCSFFDSHEKKPPPPFFFLGFCFGERPRADPREPNQLRRDGDRDRSRSR